MGALASIGTVFNLIQDAMKYGPPLLSFIHSSIAAVEQTDKSGTDKLTSVLNAVEVFAVDIMPNEAKEVQEFMKAIEEVITDVVKIYNEVGIFMHKLEGKS